MTAEREAAEAERIAFAHTVIYHQRKTSGDDGCTNVECSLSVGDSFSDHLWRVFQDKRTDRLAALAAAAGTTREAEACVRGSVLTEAVDEALNHAEQAGMTGRTRAEWVSIALAADRRVPLTFHFPAEGGGPCPTCGERYETKGATDD